MCLNLVANLVWFGIETDSGSRDFSSPPKGSQVCDMIYADITYTKRIRCTLIVYWHFEIGGFFLHFTDFTVKIDGNRHSQRGTLVSRVCLNQDIGVVKPIQRLGRPPKDRPPGLLTLHITPCEDVSQFSHPICSRQVHPCWCPLKRSSSEIYTPKTIITLENSHFQEEIHLQTVDFPLSC